MSDRRRPPEKHEKKQDSVGDQQIRPTAPSSASRERISTFPLADLQGDGLIRDALELPVKDAGKDSYYAAWQIKSNDYIAKTAFLQIPWRTSHQEPNLPNSASLRIDDSNYLWMTEDKKHELHALARTCEEIVAFQSKIIAAYHARADPSERKLLASCKEWCWANRWSAQGGYLSDDDLDGCEAGKRLPKAVMTSSMRMEVASMYAERAKDLEMEIHRKESGNR